MSLRIEETFELHAPVDRTWRYLVDPRQVVNCLPGAEITEVKDGETFLGKVKVKVGPITAAYDGRVTITGRDDAAHVVSMVGEGRERSGAGSAKMTMTSRLTPLSGNATQVQVVADVDIVGKAAQFGRGMIESVNKQLFKQFTECLRGTLEGAVADSAEFTAEPPPAAWVPAPPPRPASPRTAGAMPVVPAPAGPPLRVVPLVMRAFVEWLRRLGTALVGRPRHP
jgi:carbon monoxide dehydrogenase subunit G